MASWVNFILFVSWKAEALHWCSRWYYCCQFITGDVSLEEDNNIMSFELKNQMERWTELLMVVAPLLYLLFSIVSARLIFVVRTLKGNHFSPLGSAAEYSMHLNYWPCCLLALLSFPSIQTLPNLVCKAMNTQLKGKKNVQWRCKSMMSLHMECVSCNLRVFSEVTFAHCRGCSHFATSI